MCSVVIWNLSYSVQNLADDVLITVQPRLSLVQRNNNNIFITAIIVMARGNEFNFDTHHRYITMANRASIKQVLTLKPKREILDRLEHRANHRL